MLRRVNGVPSIMATRRTITFLLGAALWQLIGSQTALARSGFAVDSDSLPSGGGYQIMKNTLYGGGGADSLTGGGFSARSSYGQPASGTAAGGAFEVRGGVHSDSGPHHPGARDRSRSTGRCGAGFSDCRGAQSPAPRRAEVIGHSAMAANGRCSSHRFPCRSRPLGDRRSGTAAPHESPEWAA